MKHLEKFRKLTFDSNCCFASVFSLTSSSVPFIFSRDPLGFLSTERKNVDSKAPKPTEGWRGGNPNHQTTKTTGAMGIPLVQACRPSEVDESNGPISSVGASNQRRSHRHRAKESGWKKKRGESTEWHLWPMTCLFTCRKPKKKLKKKRGANSMVCWRF